MSYSFLRNGIQDRTGSAQSTLVSRQTWLMHFIVIA